MSHVPTAILASLSLAERPPQAAPRTSPTMSTHAHVDTCNPSGSCKPATANQPCDWRTSPELIGKTVYVLPLGTHTLDYPFACAPGIRGGNGSNPSEQTSNVCAGLCPAGFTCGGGADGVEPVAYPEAHYCPAGSSVALPCPAGTFGNASGLQSSRSATTVLSGISAALAFASQPHAAVGPSLPTRTWPLAMIARLALIRKRLARLPASPAGPARSALSARRRRCHAKRAPTPAPPTSRALGIARRPRLATMRQRAARSRYPAPLAHSSLRQRRGSALLARLASS